jgi:hypothetical protein
MIAKREESIVLAIGLALLAGLVICAAFAGAGPVSLAAPASIPFIGPGVSIWSDGIDNGEPVVAYNSVRDEYLVVWEDYYATEIGIYGRLVGSDGQLLGSRFAIAHWSTYTSTQPAVAYSPVHDRYLVVYTSDSKPSLPPYHDYELTAQIVNSDGTLGQAFLVDGYVDEQPWRPAVAFNGTLGEFLVVWEIEHGPYGTPGLRSDIYASRVYSDASPSWQVTARRCVVTGDPGGGGDGRNRVEPDVAYDATLNRFLIAYTREGGPDEDILGKVAAANLDGVFASSEITICAEVYNQSAVAVAASPHEYLVVWQNEDSSGGLDVYGRRLEGSVSPPVVSDPGFVINHFFSASSFAPEVAFGRTYGYMVAFQTDDGGFWEDDVYGNYVGVEQDATGDLPFFVDGGMYSSQRQPDVTCSDRGDCFFVDADDNTGDYEIDGQFMLAHQVYLPLVLRNS